LVVPGFFAGRGPTPRDDVMSPEILAEELKKHFRKSAVKIEKIWEVLQLPVLELQ
jgi:hypothetical protein